MSGVRFNRRPARNSDEKIQLERRDPPSISFLFSRLRKFSRPDTFSVFGSRFNENSIHGDSSWLTPVVAAPCSIYEDYTSLIAMYNPRLEGRGRGPIRRVLRPSRFSFERNRFIIKMSSAIIHHFLSGSLSFKASLSLRPSILMTRD